MKIEPDLENPPPVNEATFAVIDRRLSEREADFQEQRLHRATIVASIILALAIVLFVAILAGYV